MKEFYVESMYLISYKIVPTYIYVRNLRSKQVNWTGLGLSSQC